MPKPCVPLPFGSATPIVQKLCITRRCTWCRHLVVAFVVVALTSDQSALIDRVAVRSAIVTWNEEAGTAAALRSLSAATAEPCCPSANQQKSKAAPTRSPLLRSGLCFCGPSSRNCRPEDEMYVIVTRPRRQRVDCSHSPRHVVKGHRVRGAACPACPCVCALF